MIISTTTRCEQSPDGVSGRPMRILLALDKSEPARWAFSVGLKIAQEMSAKLLLVNVFVPATSIAGDLPAKLEQLDTIHRQESQELLEDYRQKLPPSVQSEVSVREGPPAEEIVEAAKVLDADLIVMGTRSRSRTARVFLGSVADAVVRRAMCPVVTVGHRVEWAIQQTRNQEAAK
jgi:nucleotide-binding universal stress UspA family protein